MRGFIYVPSFLLLISTYFLNVNLNSKPCSSGFSSFCIFPLEYTICKTQGVGMHCCLMAVHHHQCRSCFSFWLM
uniref:DNA-directed RNA polymerase I subunit RPA12-like n=1 Tax=Rhizophora mucronata TaxID=61149 RepID=A0A2P2JT40_RHIMU